jgi:hypothetical protein
MLANDLFAQVFYSIQVYQLNNVANSTVILPPLVFPSPTHGQTLANRAKPGPSFQL